MLNHQNQMVMATKIRMVNILQANQTPKLIMACGIFLSLFAKCFVNNLCIDKDEAMAPKKRDQYNLWLRIQWSTHYTFRSWSLRSTEFMLWLQKSFTFRRKTIVVVYHFCFGFIYLVFNDVATHRKKMDKICVINRHRNNAGRVGEVIKDRRLNCSPTNKKSKKKKLI